MTREEAHQLVDTLFNMEEKSHATGTGDDAAIVEPQAEALARVLPEGKQVVRTKTSGDRVYLLDETGGTRQWVTNPEVLKSLGFESSDVAEVEDNELLKYQMGPALYRVAE